MSLENYRISYIFQEQTDSGFSLQAVSLEASELEVSALEASALEAGELETPAKENVGALTETPQKTAAKPSKTHPKRTSPIKKQVVLLSTSPSELPVENSSAHPLITTPVKPAIKPHNESTRVSANKSLSLLEDISDTTPTAKVASATGTTTSEHTAMLLPVEPAPSEQPEKVSHSCNPALPSPTSQYN